MLVGSDFEATVEGTIVCSLFGEIESAVVAYPQEVRMLTSVANRVGLLPLGDGKPVHERDLAQDSQTVLVTD